MTDKKNFKQTPNHLHSLHSPG